MKLRKVEKDLNIFWLGESGFPIGLAAIQNAIVIGEALLQAGAIVTVINRKGKLKFGQAKMLSVSGKHKGINYRFASGITYRPASYAKRSYYKIKGIVNEFAILKNASKRCEAMICIISNRDFTQSLLYRIYGYLLGVPMVYLYVELASEMQNRRKARLKVNDYLFENFLLRWMDGALPISEYLIKHVRRVSPNMPVMKIPAICAFDEFSVDRKATADPYFLYCGAFAYRDVIDFVVESFNGLNNPQNYKLYLIISGGISYQQSEFKRFLSTYDGAANIKVFSNIPFADLVDLYVNAKALLIPLRPTKQDIARFPHKIAEYIATGNPIISTNYGEVSYYFKDGLNALLAESYDIKDFQRRMEFVIKQPEQAKLIGERGKLMGIDQFSHLRYGNRLLNFLTQIAKKAPNFHQE